MALLFIYLSTYLPVYLPACLSVYDMLRWCANEPIHQPNLRRWRVAAIGAVALTLGEKELAVFNTSYRVLWLANILNGSLSGAMSVKLSQVRPVL